MSVMKFTINCRTFDTATATAAAIDRGIKLPARMGGHYDTELRYEDTLYRTPSGAFFVHEHRTKKFSKGRPDVSDEAKEMTPEEAVEWIAEHNAMVFDATGLGLPPAASSASGGTFHLKSAKPQDPDVIP